MNYKAQHFIGFFLIGLLFHSCLIITGVTVENDIVDSSKRMKTEFNYRFARERHSPLILLNQNIVKEVSRNSLSQYKVYDLIKLESNSFSLADSAYIIVDNKPYRLKIDSFNSQLVPNIEEKREEILTSDSTKVSVVTGYEEGQTWDYRMAYSIDNAIMEKVKTSDNVMFRYYAGPDMITVKVGKMYLGYLKKLIKMN